MGSHEVIELNPTHFKLPSRPYQLTETKKLIGSQTARGLFWEMRLGKSKAFIDAACTLYENGEIDFVLIVCPAQVKDVWLDEELGEIKTHCFTDYRCLSYESTPHEFKPRGGDFTPGEKVLTFVVTSLEYIRQEDAQGDFPKVKRLIELLSEVEHHQVWMCVDEGSALGTWNSLQTRATISLREAPMVKRITILDGTPEGESPLCLYPKFKLLDPAILGYKTYWQFRAKHAEIITQKFGKKKSFKKVSGFKNLSLLAEKTAPYVSRLMQKDVGFKEPVRSFFSVALKPSTWNLYRQLRDQLLAELETGETFFVNHAHTKILRLAQVCAGFLGGFDAQQEGEPTITREIGRETLDGFMRWFKARYEEDPTFKCVVWCRWRPEITRLYEEMSKTYTTDQVFLGLQYGSASDANFLHPSHPYRGAGVMICQPQAAQYGLNFSKASVNVWLSGDYKRVTRRQAEDRVQSLSSEGVLILDVLVTGPQGQKTVIHDIIKCQRDKTDLAQRLSADWKRILTEE